MKKYLNNIDYFRGLAIFGIIAIHTLDCTHTEFDLIYFLNVNLKQLSTYSVPLFLFISGMVLTYVYKDEKLNYPIFIKKRVTSVLIPYLFWACMYLTYRIIIENENIGISTIIKKIIIGTAEFHLWFILLIFQLYLIYPLILKCIRRLKEHHMELLALTFIINLVIISIYYFHLNYLNERIIRKLFIFWIFYFMLGSIMGYNINYYKKAISNLSLKRISIIYSIGLIGLIVSYYSNGMLTNENNMFWLKPEVLIYATLSIILAIKLVIEFCHSNSLRLPAKIMKEIGKYSFGIYLIHIMVLNILGLLFEKIGILQSSPLYGYILFPLDLILSLILVMIISRLSFGHFIVGTSR